MKTIIMSIIFLTTMAYAIEFKKSKLTVGKTTIIAEIADTDERREQGLMHRKNLKDTEGMLFIFPKAEVQGFWMKNTIIPLSIGFFDSKGKLFQVTEMEPASDIDLDPKVYHSSKPARFALEEPKGWFTKNKIDEHGAQLRVPELHIP